MKRKLVISKKLMSKKEAYERMLDSNGVIFGVKFIKKDGTERFMHNFYSTPQLYEVILRFTSKYLSTLFKDICHE